MPTKKCNYITFGIGSVLFLVGLGLGLGWPYIFMQVLKGRMQLQPASESYKLWVRTPIPMYLDIYLFNWTNADEFSKNKSITPNFKEIGPFVFKEVHDRVNVTWNDNDTVTFNQTRTWTFVPEESPDLSTNITNLNVIPVTIAYMTRNLSFWKKELINVIMNLREKFVITKTAREWLFEGIQDNILDYINVLKNVSHTSIPFKKFGWFVDRNLSSSYDGIYTIKTGGDNIYNLGIMDRWNHMEKTEYYNDTCAMVNGTTGELFPPSSDPQKPVSVFISDICRSISLKHVDTVTERGLVGHKYVGDASIFDNGTLYPDNKCFCKGECIPSGALNASACRLGAPVFVSFPHFYLADPSYSKAVSGMKPNKTEHEFFIALEPMTGVPVTVRAQLQINILLQPIPTYTFFKGVPKVYFPMLWFRQRATVTSELADRAKTLLIIPEIGLAVFYSIAIAGIVMILFGLFFLIKPSKGNQLLEPLIRSSDDEPVS